MKKSDFESGLKEKSREYRAVCNSLKGHWEGTWHTTYTAASAEANQHVQTGGEFHAVWIEQRITSRAKYSRQKISNP